MADNQKWEYSVQNFPTVSDSDNAARNFGAAVNKYAEEGWELISVNLPFHYFRRDKNRKPSELK